MRVDPEMTSGPTSAQMVMSATCESAEFGLQVMAAVFGAASPGVLYRTDDVWCTTGGGDADDDVFARGATLGDVALAEFGGVLVDVRGAGEGLGAAGHKVLNLLGIGREGGGALGGVEGSDAAGGTGADVDEAAAVAERTRDGVDHHGDLGEGLFDGRGDLGVFLVDDAGDLKGGLGVQSGRGLVHLFCG